MNKKISCGGFEIDNETLIEKDGVLSAVTSGDGVPIIVVEVSKNLNEWEIDYIDKQFSEIKGTEYSIALISISGSNNFLIAPLTAIITEGDDIYYSYIYEGANGFASFYFGEIDGEENAQFVASDGEDLTILCFNDQLTLPNVSTIFAALQLGRPVYFQYGETARRGGYNYSSWSTSSDGLILNYLFVSSSTVLSSVNIIINMGTGVAEYEENQYELTEYTPTPEE